MSLSALARGTRSDDPPGRRASWLKAVDPRFGIAGVAGLLALLPLFFGDSRSLMGVITVGVLFACYGVAFNIVFGSTGQLFLCVGALAGIGGFTSVLLTDRAGLPLVVGLAAAAVASALVGSLLSWVAVRRSLDVIFVGIVTLAFSLAYQNLVLGLRDLTGGESGLRVQTGSDTFLGEAIPAFYVFVAVLVVYLVVFWRLRSSSMGWAFRALRDDEVAAELAGVDVSLYRVYAGAIGSAMLGFVGAVYAHAEGFIGPSTYAFGHVDVRTLVMVVFGGVGGLFGPVLGAAVFTVADEVLVEYSQLRLMMYGMVILALFLYRFSPSRR